MEAAYEPLLGSPPPVRVRIQDVLSPEPPAHAGPAKSHTASESESVDYLPADSQVYRQWLATQRPWKGDRWLMLAVVGISVGSVAYWAHLVITAVSWLKLFFIQLLVKPNSPVALAWLVDSTYSMLLVALAAEVVLRWAPEAAGSGVPEVMAHLNGVVLPHTFHWRTAAVKFVSFSLCVGSGLPVGQGGPMIFLGAALGGLISQGTGFLRRSRLLRRYWPFGRFRDTQNKRDFMTAGCAAGVAAAFRAPLGGLLYVFEDVASFWTTRLGWQVFITSVIAVVTWSLSDSVFALVRNPDVLKASLFQEGLFFGNMPPIQTTLLACVLAAVVGFNCGLGAAAFTSVSMAWSSKVRARYVGRNRRRQLLEPCLFMLAFATLALVLPQAFECRDLPIMDLGDYDITDSQTGGGTLQSYTCPPVASLNSTVGNFTSQYNELSSLMNVRGTDALKKLMYRGSRTDFGFASLFTYLGVYSSTAALVSGSAISSGLLIPMMTMGASIGRIHGLAAVHIAYASGHNATELIEAKWQWVDPGLFAAVGAAAFLGGGTRQPLSSAVILLETTGEVRFLLPILVAIAVAKWVADFLSPSGIYLRQLQAKRIPFLPSEPPRKLPLRERPVSCIMCPGPIVCVEELGSLRDAASALLRTTGHSFPVVRDGAVVGLISREHLGRVVAAALAAGEGPHPKLTYPELEGRRGADGTRQPTWPPATPRVGVAAHAFSPSGNGWYSESDGEEDDLALRSLEWEQSPLPAEGTPGCSQPLDILPYINVSAITVGGQCSSLRAYMLFRTLGLRHLPVLDERGRAVGIITRKELLREHLVARLLHSPPPMTEADFAQADEAGEA